MWSNLKSCWNCQKNSRSPDASSKDSSRSTEQSSGLSVMASEEFLKSIPEYISRDSLELRCHQNIEISSNSVSTSNVASVQQQQLPEVHKEIIPEKNSLNSKESTSEDSPSIPRVRGSMVLEVNSIANQSKEGLLLRHSDQTLIHLPNTSTTTVTAVRLPKDIKIKSNMKSSPSKIQDLSDNNEQLKTPPPPPPLLTENGDAISIDSKLSAQPRGSESPNEDKKHIRFDPNNKWSDDSDEHHKT